MASYNQAAARSRAVALRTYCQPLNPQGTLYETWQQAVRRSMFDHHVRLWEEAGGKPDLAELEELYQLGLELYSTVAGRTLWLGGTDYAYTRPCCQYNCSFGEVNTVYDVVDIAWLLLNGCGVGFKAIPGTLHGFVRPIHHIQIIGSDKPADYKGPEHNEEIQPSSDNGYTWTIRVGDSAQAWAKAVGKLLNQQSRRVDKLVIDGSNVRGPGHRLAGYGWVCNGFAPFGECLEAIAQILNRKAGDILDSIDIGDIINHIGEILSSRRSAQIWLMDSSSPEVERFAGAKRDYWLHGNDHRRQSNNSEIFWSKPSYNRILELLVYASEGGGDPGIVNGEAARHKAPWFQGLNPCAEIFLGAFCNLVTNNLPFFKGNLAKLYRALHLIARANYRQTCVNMQDGILQPRWHQNNASLRLCGVSLTGIMQCDWLTDYTIRQMRYASVAGAYSMADELGLPRPKAITTIKPEGTISKVFGCTEGIHLPLSRWLQNWINFSQHDPIVGLLEASGYKIIANPSDNNNVLASFPIDFGSLPGLTKVNGMEVNLEPATSQLRRYLRWNNLWADHNVSCTISYDKSELPDLARAIHDNWEHGFISTSVLERGDPTKTAKDLGHPYLPQEPCTRDSFEAYASRLRPVDWSQLEQPGPGHLDISTDECARGACPIK